MYQTVIPLTPTTRARIGLVALDPAGPYRLTVDHPATHFVEYFVSSSDAMGRWVEIESGLRHSG